MTISIPPEALEAARKGYNDLSQDDPIEAACIAMLRAWPNAVIDIRLTALAKALKEECAETVKGQRLIWNQGTSAYTALTDAEAAIRALIPKETA